ncbi:MAG TPA: S41 family peptidase [Chitinophaga sp.]|uniref:S41 family peptidase n=1 Tax=Chitinophaga sp. TaxID=1869181 RepID=UPI002C46D7C4|nr:S41 family peptidase [Chitinophaga sp.]HVI48238.1 S41 family peptidase [Chitinophaga sp.]
MNFKQTCFRSLAVLAILYTAPLSAQEKKLSALTQEDLLTDFDLMSKILQHQHPNIYKFTDSVTFRHSIDSLRSNIIRHPTIYTFFTNLPSNLVRDAHLSLSPSNDYSKELYSDMHFFPFPVIIERGRMFVDIKGEQIPFGTEILSINDVSVKDILQRLSRLSNSDGYTNNGIDRVNYDFQFYYGITTPEARSFKIVYKDPGSSKTSHITLPALAPAAAYHSTNRRVLPVNTLQRAYNIYTDFLENEQTGVLTVNTFSLGEAEAYKEFSKFFKEVNKRKFKQVIIDIRSNYGGDPAISSLLYSFLSDKPFTNIYNYRTHTIDISYPEYVVDGSNRRVSEEDIRNNKNFYYQRFDRDSSGIYNGNARLKEGLLENYPPDKDAFHGRVFVLTGGGTISAATYFATLVQKNKRGIITGKETGSGEASTTAAWFVQYLLPGTKSILTVPRTEIYFFNATTDNGHGVIPDKEVPLPAFIQYLQAGKDPELSFVLDMKDK